MVEKIQHLIIEEEKVPENNILEQRFQKFFHFLGVVTSPSNIRGHNKERSLLNRRKRKEILREVFEARKTEGHNSEAAKKRIAEARVRDEISAQYLNQSEVVVGEDSARFVSLTPPESKENERSTPIVLIPGLSNDIDPVGMLAQELAFQGRKVIVIGYPESTMGSVSKVFLSQMGKTRGFEAHGQFFQKAVSSILGNNQEIELWAHSTGGPIAAEILNDGEFSKKVKNAVIISPMSSVDQSLGKMGLGLLREVLEGMRMFPNLAKYSLVAPGIDEDEDQVKLKGQVFSSLLKKIIKRSDKWKTMKVQEGGKIVFWSGGKDGLTKSSQADELFNENEQAITMTNPNGSHLTGLIKPEIVIPEIHKALSQ